MPQDAQLVPLVHRVAPAPSRPLRIMSGPGTGKTTTLNGLVASLLREGVQPSRILAVTFTRTAAGDLVRELASLGVPGCERIRAGTLHSFCFTLLLRAEVFEYLHRNPRPIVASGTSCYSEMLPMLHDLNNKETYGSIRDRMKRILAFEAAWARLQHEEPGWPRTPTDRQFHQDLRDWLSFHEAILIGELVPLALDYLRNNPVSPERSAYDYVIVDEYQDLNKAEQKLVDLLASNGALAVAGDEDQSIYSFRHAHPEGIREFADTHPGTHDEILLECRRCPTQVVELANHLISHNHPPDAGPRLRPYAGNPLGEVYIVQWDSLEEEAAGIAAFVRHLITTRGYGPSDILILSPRRIIAHFICDALQQATVPTHSFYCKEALDNDRFHEALALLTLLANRYDRVALRFWLGCKSRSWLVGQYSILRECCMETGLSPWDALEKVNSGKLNLRGVGRLLERFRELRANLERLQALTGQPLLDSLFPANEEWAEPVREEIPAQDDTDAQTLLDLLRDKIIQPETPEAGDYVRVMSLHKAKGLKSRVVIVAGCIQGVMPSLTSASTPLERKKALEEQRRLFYVAITRTQEVLVLSSVRRLRRELAHRMCAELHDDGSSEYGMTGASSFIGELGPTAPAPKTGIVWLRSGFR